MMGEPTIFQTELAAYIIFFVVLAGRLYEVYRENFHDRKDSFV